MATAESSSRDFAAIDPTSGAELGTYRDATSDEVAAAAAAAGRVSRCSEFDQRARRAELLRAIADRLRGNGQAIVSGAAAETGLAEGRLAGELERTARQVEAFGELVARGDYVDAYIDPPDPDAKPIPRPDVRRMLVPIGPVAVFGASNFPLAFSVAGGDTASALAAGCPVIVKGHPSHPGTSEVVAHAISAAVAEVGLPDGIFCLLQSGGAEVGEELVARPEIAAVAFTGSRAAGRALYDRAAARANPIPVYAEMSSINPLVVTAAALERRGAAITDGLTASISNSAGQLCTKPGLIFAPAGPAAQTLEADLRARLSAVGPQPLLGQRIRDALEHQLEELSDRAEALSDKGNGAAPSQGYWSRPHLFRTTAGMLASTPELREECFGPVAVIVEYDGHEDLLAALAELEGQLTATVHAEASDLDSLRSVVSALERLAGRVIFNGYPTGVAVTHAMHHGGPYPATTFPGFTSVGMTAIARFLRPVAWQDAPEALLPPELRDGNPCGIARRVDGRLEVGTRGD
jgi:NADP-dependent aldehyde dehydrogenase